MTPRTATMTVRRGVAMARGAPASEATVVASMAPIIQASGRFSRLAVQPPRVPTASARTMEKRRRQASTRRGDPALGTELGGEALEQSLHEALAERDLLQGDELVRLVRLVDRTGAADHCRNAGLGNQAGLGAEGDLGGAVGPGQRLGQLHDLVPARRVEPGEGRVELELDSGVRP